MEYNNYENEEEIPQVQSRQDQKLKNQNNNNMRNKNYNVSNNDRNYVNKGNQNYDDEEIQNLKNIINKLQNDLNKKDSIIQNQKEEKIKLTKRIEELERMLSSFLAMDKGQ